MRLYSQKYGISALLIILVISLVILKDAAAFLDGYYIIFPLYFGYFLFDLFAPIIVIIAFGIVVAVSIRRRHFNPRYVLIWILVILLLFIKGGHFQALGAWLSVQNAGAIQVRDDARGLLDDYEPMTYFGFPERSPFNRPLPRSQLPASLRAIHIEGVLVLRDYVFMGKYGTTALLRGYVVFREGMDVWSDEPNIVLQQGCDYCWRIRIVDGLYWYHTIPQKEEIPTFASPLE